MRSRGRSHYGGTGGRSTAQSPYGVAGRFRLINRFLDKHARNCSPVQAMVWVVLWRDSRDGVAKTSYSRLADRLGVSRATVARAIRLLRDMGYLEVVRRGGDLAGPTLHKIVIWESPVGVSDANAQKIGSKKQSHR